MSNRNVCRRFAVTGVVVLMLSLGGPAPATAGGLADDPRVRATLAGTAMWLDYQAVHREAPGMSVAIVRDQEVLWSSGFGLADVEHGIRATPATRYSICSISKVFTATAIMQLRDAGKLRLVDGVGDLLPWFGPLRADPDGGPVTVLGLLTHTSGLPKDLDRPYWSRYDFPTRDEFVAAMGQTEPLHRPSEVEEYSNVGFTLAGMIVEATSGQSFDDYLRQHILVPLKLQDTTADIPAGPGRTGLAVGYSGLGREHHRNVIPPYQLKAMAPAAGMVSTVGDLAKFAEWQFRLLSRGGTEVLKASSLREMHQVHWYEAGATAHVGLAYTVVDIGGKLYVGKDGGCPGYQSLLLMSPASKTAVVVMINANDIDVWELARGALEMLEPVIGQATATVSAGSEPDPSLAVYGGVYRGYPSDMEMGVVTMGRELSMVPLNQKSPRKGLVTLKPAGKDRFGRYGSDGTFHGYLTFGRDEHGVVSGYRQPGSEWTRVQRGLP